MAKGKIVTESQHGGQRAQNIVGAIVETMGHLWRPNTGLDAGIDGHIEIRNTKTGEATNQIVQVQVKSKENSFLNETKQSFEFICDERDLLYWLGGNCPVILVMVRRSSGDAFWANIKGYFKDDALRRSRKVVFNKKRDRFEKGTAQKIVDVAVPAAEGFYLPAVPLREDLRCNLLKVRTFGARLYNAECLLKSGKEVAEALRPSTKYPDFDWVMKGGRLLTFHDLREQRWKDIVDRGTIEDFDTSEWADSDDPKRLYLFVELLNLCLRKKLAPLGTRWYGKRKVVFFGAHKKGVVRDLRYRSYRVRTTRQVVSAHMRTDDATLVSYYLHHAVEFQFLRFDGDWYVALNPTYHYTSDGEALYPHYEALLKGSSLFDKNQSLSGQTRMWIELLQEPHGAFTERYPFLTFDQPQTFPVSVGVPDRDWLGTDDEEKTEEEATQESGVAKPIERSLFDA